MGAFAETASTIVEDTRCKMGRVTEGFDADDVAELKRLAVVNKISVIRALLPETVSPKITSTHLKGHCTCPDSMPTKGLAHG